MVDEIKKIIIVVILFAAVFMIFFTVKFDENNKNKNEADLVIFGENIDATYKPFIDGDGIYVSINTISKTIDENIFYDKVATKVIITNSDEVIKLKVDEPKISRNFEYSDIKYPAKIYNQAVYIPINLFTDVYNINVEYNDETNTIVIDKKSSSDVNVTHNKVKVYEDINTSSKVLQILNTNNTVTVYDKALAHSRWYKVKTETGVVGYIAKNNVNLVSQDEEVSPEEVSNKEKIVMFWQYGSKVDSLGNSKVNGVNVVSPTWYELKNAKGEISSEFSQEYYSKAKEYGYKIWPIITNGIDSANYSAETTSTVMNSEYLREQLIKNILDVVKTNKLDGINIDFEVMKEEDRDLYTQFIRELAPLMKKQGATLSVDMYFVKYIDRSRVGEVADYVMLMGYDHRGSWSSEAGSIAEVSWVEENVNSLINDSNINPNKIVLGIPFYTRLWTIKQGEDKPKTTVYDMKDCQDFIDKYDITTVWDEDAGQNYAEYTKGSVTYKLWLEDKDSVKKRVETVNKYKLAGIAGWRRGLETSDVWEVINQNLQK